MSALAARTATELAGLIARRAVSPVEVVESCLAAIDAANPALNAFCLVAARPAREAARRAERAAEPLGPLHGVPVAIKDVTPTVGLRTTFGSRAYADFVPSAEGAVIARLRAAGAIVVGKTTTPEFGLKGVTESPLLGRTNNPWDPSRTSGGSSGGAAAAVAAGLVPLAEGTDGAGSIRIPASCCGVVGIKPSFGRLPLGPRNPFETLVHQGPIAGTVEDAALMLAAVAGPSDGEVYGIATPPEHYVSRAREASVRGWRIAYSPDLGLPGVAPDVAAAVEAAAQTLADLGAEVELATPELPDPREPMMTMWQTLYGAIVRDRVLPRIGREDMDPDLVALLDASLTLDAATYYDAAYSFRQRLFAAMCTFFRDYRLLLTPTLTRTAMPHPADGLDPAGVGGSPAERFLGWFRTYHFNLTGQPAASVPCGSDADGMPIGLQLVGRPRADGDVIAAAAAYEQAVRQGPVHAPPARFAGIPAPAPAPLVV